MNPGRESFGERLRAERERAGVSLETIVQVTKIQRSLLVGLENDDLTQWPIGIFRRAFFREYLSAIGIRSEAYVSEFVRLFPDNADGAPDRREGSGFDAPTELRIQLAPAPPFSSARRWLLQAAASASDLCAVLVVSAWAVVLLRAPVWPATAAVALLYYGVSVAWLGYTPGLWWFFQDRSAHTRRPLRLSDVPALRIISRQPDQADAPSDATNVA